jgi:polysaccharide deacetylase 2 family uncharacterized protein YibQ
MAQRRRTPTKGSPWAGVLLFLLGILVGGGLFYLACRRGGEPPEGKSPAPAHSRESGGPRQSPRGKGRKGGPEGEEGLDQAPATVVPKGGGAEGGVRVALVIDDLGTSVDELQPLAALGIPLTYSVLPFADQTPQVVAELQRRRVELLLHLPMEPRAGQPDPGPGALRLGMSDAELRQRTLAALAAVPGATGVNNHMGSMLSANEPAMRTVLGVLASRNLFFLDSRTSAASVGYRLAIDLGMPAAERQVFLDDDPAPAAIDAQFQRFLTVARQKGAAVAIGHPHPTTFEALARDVPKAKQAGVTFVPVSYLLDRPGDPQ